MTGLEATIDHLLEKGHKISVADHKGEVLEYSTDKQEIMSHIYPSGYIRLRFIENDLDPEVVMPDEMEFEDCKQITGDD